MTSGLGTGKTKSGEEPRCPNCAGRKIIKKGFQKNKFGSVQIYYCKSCSKRFINRLLKNKTYDANVIREALQHHNRGNSLSRTRNLINRKFKLGVAKSTVHNWVREYKHLTLSTAKQRKDHDPIVSKQFRHKGISYNFKYDKPKLYRTKYPKLVEYILRFTKGCPEFFKDIDKRCSASREIIADTHVLRFTDAASRAATLAITTSSSNTDRHVCVENFMLLNDENTVAVEVPVWFYEKNLGTSISGHIDILQTRKGRIYVLDYKPGAAKLSRQRVVAQLYLYARALSFRTGLPLTFFRCAWFDEQNYFEFNPAKTRVRFQTPDGTVFEDRYTKKHKPNMEARTGNISC